MRGILWGAVALAVFLVTAPAALAQPAPSIVVEDGVTQPVFGYADAIRERVWVESSFDTDGNGENDLIALDVMRPQATDEGLEVPAIMDPSPYFTTVCRGNEGECIDDVDGDGINDKWPLFYDNYFVPRGYAMILLHMVGTGFSTGCPVTGGNGDFLSVNMAVDWLSGRRTARDADGDVVTADWFSGRAGAIGKSYDGTLANGAASTGVEGLTTIVPISAISSWYDYTRSNGILTRSNYLGSLANTVTNPSRRAYCSPVRSALNAAADDSTGDYNDAWAERDYNDDVGNVRASVFVSHGVQDDNVRPDHFRKWWDGLTALDVPRKLWLNGSGHEDPFDYRRAEWVETIHRWFDYWLQGYPNGIMDEPMVDIEVAAGEFETANDWPVPTTGNVNVWLRPGDDGEAGSFALTPAPGKHTARSFVDDPNQFESAMINDPEEFDENRLVFLSEPLEADLRISGTPVVNLTASSSLDEAYFGAILVDYGPKTRISRSSDGVISDPSGEEDCWGESSAADDACYRVTTTLTTEADQWRVSKGILDGRNRNSYSTAEPLVSGEMTEIGFPLLPNDYVFPAGNRIGVVLVGSYRSYSAARISSRPTITVDTKVSRIALPVVGGHQAARAAGIPER